MIRVIFSAANQLCQSAQTHTHNTIIIIDYVKLCGIVIVYQFRYCLDIGMIEKKTSKRKKLKIK